MEDARWRHVSSHPVAVFEKSALVGKLRAARSRVRDGRCEGRPAMCGGRSPTISTMSLGHLRLLQRLFPLSIRLFGMPVATHFLDHLPERRLSHHLLPSGESEDLGVMADEAPRPAAPGDPLSLPEATDLGFAIAVTGVAVVDEGDVGMGDAGGSVSFEGGSFHLSCGLIRPTTPGAESTRR